MTMQTVRHHGIMFDGEVLEKFCLKSGIKKMSLYGSCI